VIFIHPESDDTMKKFSLTSTIVAAMLVALLPTASANAQNGKSYVSGISGNDANSCNISDPCRSFQVAYDHTGAGGEINCLDPIVTIFSLVISKSITLDCGSSPVGSLTSGGTAITINGAGIFVIIRNLSIDGVSSAGGSAIEFTNGAALMVQNCVIQNYNAGAAVGIRFRPTTAGPQLAVSDTTLSNNGTGSVGGGIVISPQSGGTAQVALNRVTVLKNVFGIAADGSSSAGGINMTIADSIIGGNS
jgi:hypothetical protein